MKLTKIAKRAIACGLAITLAVSGIGLPANTVSAAKKVKLNKTKLSVTAGKTATLKVKNATKKVTWSTSNKKVVKVKKTSGKKKATAKLKAVKKGTAKITAKVGSKKLTCKVTVKAQAVSIKSVSVDPLDSSCIVMTMKKAQAINVSDLTIGLKSYNEGTYNYEPTVKTLTTMDQITYRVYLSNSLSEGVHVKIALSSTDYLESQYTVDITDANHGEVENVTIEKDATIRQSCFDYFDHTIGTTKFSIKSGALPDGMELNAKRGIIKGIPTTVGNYSVTLQAVDELGRKGTSSINYVVYDKTVIVCPDQKAEVILDDEVEKILSNPATYNPTEDYFRVGIAPKGGSGSYKFSLTASDTADTALSTDIKDAATGTVTSQLTAEESRLRIPYAVAAGTHTFTVTITDAVNPAIQATTNITVDAKKYYNISGTAKDNNGGNLSGNYVRFYPSDATSSSDYIVTTYVGSSSTATELGVMKGTFATELPAGSYIVKVYSDADGIYYHMTDQLTVGEADGTAQIVVPVRFYSVLGTATYANGNPITDTRIYFETKDQQYETYSVDFGVVTDKTTGAFVASLPANTYVAYIVDNGKRYYFNGTITITDADVNLTSFALNISRYKVSGSVKRKSGDSTVSLGERYVRFYNPDGEYVQVETDENGGFSVNLEGAAAGIAYVAKVYDYNSSVYHTLTSAQPLTITEGQGTLTVELTYDLTSLFANVSAQVPTNGTVLPITTEKVAESYAKLTVDQYGSYSIVLSSATGDQFDSLRYIIYDEDGDVEASVSDYESISSISRTVYLSAGTYYIYVLPQMSSGNGYTQVARNLNLSVTALNTTTSGSAISGWYQ